MTQTTASNLLALDVGERRIGVALAGSVARLPGPLLTIEREDSVFEDIKRLVREERAASVIIGLPRGLDGQETAQTQAVYEFGDELKKYLSVPVYYQDEALTSRLAEQELKAGGKPYNKPMVDALAATYILADYLTQHPGAIA